jgi:hypothetical protein
VNERGYVGAHDASVIRRSQERAQPKGLAGLLRWFVDRWSAETSTELHARGVWVGRQQYGKDGPRWRPELVGGSLLGHLRMGSRCGHRSTARPSAPSTLRVTAEPR